VHHFQVRNPAGAERKVEIIAIQHKEKQVLDLTSDDGDIWQLIRQGENSDHLNRQRTDEKLILPTSDDLARGVDPVLVRGAGKIFPVEWRKD
jgi:hypothetical protein